jgi:hypothetical protein
MNLLHEFLGDPLKHAEREKKARQGRRTQLTATDSSEQRPQQGPLRSALSLIRSCLFPKPSRTPGKRSPTPHAYPSPRPDARQWDAVLNNCDLLMARQEIAQMHRNLNAEAQRKGGHYMFPQEYVAAWEAFREEPSIHTARVLLQVAPPLLQYFQACSPGSELYSTNRLLERRGT